MGDLDQKSLFQWELQNKLESTSKFENRQLQLIGLVGILFAIISPFVNKATDMVFILLIVTLVFEAALIGMYIYSTWPSKLDDQVANTQEEASMSMNIYQSRLDQINETLSRKTTSMRISYIIFAIAIFSLQIASVIG